MWLNKKASLYSGQTDITGRSESFRDIMLCTGPKYIETLVALKRLDRSSPNYKIKAMELKSRLPLFSPSALMQTRKSGNVVIIEKTSMMQMDWDYDAIHEYDMDELKKCVFSLPFVAFVGKSCSGYGIYALIQIAEPEKLREYAQHCFEIFKKYSIPPDTSKGRNYSDLRYVSYDPNMLIRENPEPLLIKRFYKPAPPNNSGNYNISKGIHSDSGGLIKSLLQKIQNASVGNRWETVQRVAFTLGGLGDESLLYAVKSEIEANPEFNGQEEKYCKCAEECFAAGLLKPLKQQSVR